MPVNLLDPHVAHNRASEDGRTDGPRRLMSDVLQRATLLSQRQIVDSNEVRFCLVRVCSVEADKNAHVSSVLTDLMVLFRFYCRKLTKPL